MPWTLSHPAAVLPLRRLGPLRLDFAALIVGSMTPDIGYHIGSFALADVAHTFRGSFVACVPTGIVMLVIIYIFSRPVCYALPQPHRQLLQPLCPKVPKTPVAWSITLLSVLLGAWTHTFWDAFTHRNGWFAERIPWLQQPIMAIGSTTLYRALVLQHLSTLVGLAIMLVVYVRWLRRQQPTEASGSGSDTLRYIFWIATLVVAFAISFPAAVHYAEAASFHGLLLVDSVIFRVAIYAPRIAVPMALIGSTVIYSKRPR